MPAIIPYEKAISKTLVQLPNGEMQEIRRFTESGIQTSIDKALAGVEERSATVELEKNPTGLNVAIAIKFDKHWSLAGAWRRDDWGDSFSTKAKYGWK